MAGFINIAETVIVDYFFETQEGVRFELHEIDKDNKVFHTANSLDHTHVHIKVNYPEFFASQ